MGVSEKSLSWVTDRVTEREREGGRASERTVCVPIAKSFPKPTECEDI